MSETNYKLLKCEIGSSDLWSSDCTSSAETQAYKASVHYHRIKIKPVIMVYGNTD